MNSTRPVRIDALPGEASSTDGVDESSSPQSSLDNRLNRLVERIINGLCVPFLGAGISLSSPAPPNAPTINASEIARKLAQKLFARLPPQSSTAPAHYNLRKFGLECAKLDENGNPIPNPDPKSPSKLLTPALGEVAELCWSVLMPTGTCEVLELERWNERLPTAAHHYLAILVREGLITEVLETNYDEFVEKAVKETFGDESDATSLCANVISDLESYRRHIASPRDSRKQRSLVKVVKLNGCAAAYSRTIQNPNASFEDKEKAARRIILTEEQLQNWGDKHWARELLNDRVRSRTLLFIGFGNSDPIVRHHSVHVIREFQTHAVVSHLRPYDACSGPSRSPIPEQADH